MGKMKPLQVNRETRLKLYFVFLIFVFFLLGRGYGEHIHWDGSESSGSVEETGFPLYWIKVSETHYVDRETEIDVEYNIVNFTIDLLCYSFVSGVFVYGFDRVSWFLESSVTSVREAK